MAEALAVSNILKHMNGFRGRICQGGGPMPFSILTFNTKEPSLKGKNPTGSMSVAIFIGRAGQGESLEATDDISAITEFISGEAKVRKGKQVNPEWKFVPKGKTKGLPVDFNMVVNSFVFN